MPSKNYSTLIWTVFPKAFWTLFVVGWLRLCTLCFDQEIGHPHERWMRAFFHMTARECLQREGWEVLLLKGSARLKWRCWSRNANDSHAFIFIVYFLNNFIVSMAIHKQYRHNCRPLYWLFIWVIFCKTIDYLKSYHTGISPGSFMKRSGRKEMTWWLKFLK